MLVGMSQRCQKPTSHTYAQFSFLVITTPKSAQKKAADISATFIVQTSASRLAITNRNDTRDSTEGHRSMRMDADTEDHSRRERSRSCSTLGRTRRNKQGHSRHSSRTPVRHSNRNPGHRRSTLCHRSPRQQLVHLRGRDPNHPATLGLVMVSPRQ